MRVAIVEFIEVLATRIRVSNVILSPARLPIPPRPRRRTF